MQTQIALEDAGYDAHFKERFEAANIEGAIPARVAVQQRGIYTIVTARGIMPARLPGSFTYQADGAGDLPAVGDFVAVVVDEHGSATIQRLLERKTAFSRKIAGDETQEQILAANVDVVFVTMSLTTDFNLRRLERFMTAAYSSGASPVILLTKSDVCDDVEAMAAEVSKAHPGTPVLVVSAVMGAGMDEVSEHLAPGTTAVLLGSSGVGKSTLVNRLAGSEALEVREVRDDGKGRHTTTHREMIVLDGGGIVIDTPGMREFQMWDVEDGLDRTFDDVAELAATCRFSDCNHDSEPGCAIRAALEDGSLDRSRYESYLKLQRELAWIKTKMDKRAAADQTRRWKKIHKEAKARTRHR